MQHTKTCASLALLLMMSTGIAACDQWGDGGEFPPQPIATSGPIEDDQMQDAPERADDGSGGIPDPLLHPCEVIGEQLGRNLTWAFRPWVGEPTLGRHNPVVHVREIEFLPGFGWEWNPVPGMTVEYTAIAMGHDIWDTQDRGSTYWGVVIPQGAPEYVFWAQVSRRDDWWFEDDVLGTALPEEGWVDVEPETSDPDGGDLGHFDLHYWTGVVPGEHRLRSKGVGRVMGRPSLTDWYAEGGRTPAGMLPISHEGVHFAPAVGLCIEI